MVSSFLPVCASNNNTKPLNTARISLLWGVHGQTSVKRGKKKKTARGSRWEATVLKAYRLDTHCSLCASPQRYPHQTDWRPRAL